MVAHALGTVSNAVTVHVRRMGGGFGGKETQGNQFAAIAAIAAKKLNRAVKIRPDRDDDMIITGKRHDFVVDYDVGFDESGVIHALDATFAARCGHSEDLSLGVRNRHFITRQTIDPERITSPKLADDCVDFATRARPLFDWGIGAI